MAYGAPVADRDAIIAFLDDLLDSNAFTDYGPNGIQVPGTPDVQRVVTGVSAHIDFFRRALARDAQLLLCHHGIFWGGPLGPIDTQMKTRLKLLFDADATLAAYHLPLDAHPEVGNNALIIEGLGFDRARSFAEHKGRDIGWTGTSQPGVLIDDLLDRCREVFERDDVIHFPGGPQRIHSIGVVSGGGSGDLGEAASLSLDAFISGEPSEPGMADARELGIHFIAGGHWATETFGIRLLGDLVAEKFGVEHEFLPLRNPV
jgi:dinuclear metal center YbgI/SA1388 family protein